MLTESFLPGLVDFTTYLSKLDKPTSLSGTELIRIMDSFQDDFENHFHSEIKTIAAFADHPKAPVNGTAEGDLAFDTFKTWGKNTVQKAGFWDVVPFFMVNLDVTAEDGMWKNWPPMPPPIKWGLTNIAGAWYSSYWKFSSCDSVGQPQELYALRNIETDAKKDEL